MSDANDVLMGAAVPTAKIDLGLPPVAGRIVAISEPYQEREYDPKNPGTPGPLKVFPSGDPIMSFSIDLATGQVDPSIENDDGVRRIYMDGARIKKAVREAVRAVGAKGVAVGGWLSITCTHYDEPGNRQSGKNYATQYVPGAPANDVLMNEPQQPVQAPQYAPQAPPQQYAPPPVQQPVQPSWNPGAPGYPQQGMPAPQQPAYAPPAAPQAPAQQVAPPAPQPPVQAPAPAAPAQPGQPTAEQVAAVRAAGMDPAQVWPGFAG